MLRTVPLVALLALSACKNGDSDTALELGPRHWEQTEDLGAPATALAPPMAAAGGSLWEIEGLSGWLRLGQELPPERVSFLAAIPGPGGDTRLAWVDGRGLYRNPSPAWEAVEPQPSSALLSTLNPRAHTVPFGWSPGAADGEGWLAALGGLFHTTDDGQTWERAEDSTLLFTDVAVQGDTVVAVAPRPAGLVPSELGDLLTASVLVSEDGGQGWDDHTGDAPFRFPTGVALDADGQIYVAAMDGGLYREEAGTWAHLGGPADAVELSWFAGGAAVASASRGLWRWEPEAGWTGVETGPVAALDGALALGVDGRLWSVVEGPGEPPPEPADGQVYIALSHHVSLAHSHRGDTNDARGYGVDLEAMRTTLDTLDDRPEVHADWDMDSYFSLDGWLSTVGIDVLARIQERVRSGQDGLRLMSWTAGALAAQTREELDDSITLAMTSYDEVFGPGTWDPGVQPQGSMFTRDHVEWYSELGLEWITLPYSGTPVTALRQELELPVEALYAPITMVDGEHDLTLVPTYHYADIADHGGLRAWAQQIHDGHDGDSLLVVHANADAAAWASLSQELDDLDDLDFVHFTTLQDYLDEHPPTLEVDAPDDVAEGTGDGLQSWAEKTFSHDMATAVVRAREDSDRALALAGDDEEVVALVQSALHPRLLALSAAHFGPSAPELHPDRRARALGYADDALAGSRLAYSKATGSCGSVAAKSIHVVNTRDTGGVAVVQASLRVPEDTWAGPEGLLVTDPDGVEIPIAVDILSGATDPVVAGASFTIRLAAREEVELSWDYDVELGERATGDLTEGDLTWDHLPLALPFTECAGERAEADNGPHWNPSVDDRGVRGEEIQRWELPLCDDEGWADWTWTRWHGLPGVVLEVSGQVGEPSDPTQAESVALSPLVCDGPAEVLSWRSMGGTLRSRTVRQGQETWNASAADGWVSLTCADGTGIHVAHDVTRHTSLAFAPLRTSEEDAVLAPLGTLWGDPPRHDARRTGGHGMGDVMAGVVGPQFAPSAPDWAGRNQEYALYIADELDPGTMDLFAHPPVVRSGPLTGG